MHNEMVLRGDRLREERERRGLKQSELADLCGVTMFQISRYETGKSEPGSTVLHAIARHLNVSADYLLGLTDYPNGYHGETLSGDHGRLIEAYEVGDSEAVMELVLARVRQLKSEKSGGE